MTGEREIRLAIPCAWPGGLGALRSCHFVQCDCFTLVDLNGENILYAQIIPNPPHQQGECLDPVRLLKGHGTEAIIVHGIGCGPFTSFRRAGIEVYLGKGDEVQETVRAFLKDEISVIERSQVCGG